jgi:hypothetical protein
MKQQRKRVYVIGRGFADISKSLLSKLMTHSAQPAQNFIKAALKSGSEVAGDKVGSFIASKLTEKVLPNKQENLRAIEELERKIKSNIESYSGSGFKKI